MSLGINKSHINIHSVIYSDVSWKDCEINYKGKHKRHVTRVNLKGMNNRALDGEGLLKPPAFGNSYTPTVTQIKYLGLLSFQLSRPHSCHTSFYEWEDNTNRARELAEAWLGLASLLNEKKAVLLDPELQLYPIQKLLSSSVS